VDRLGEAREARVTQDGTIPGTDTHESGLVTAVSPKGSVLEVLWVALLRLGLTSFGSPIAHLGYLRVDWQARDSY
jgi:hypothetical protein